ncbi:MAG TPA: ATP-binding protein [Bryobacteraceae bacterium]|nr:ATP-binding protein [Bryobacteraceae bacterium]
MPRLILLPAFLLHAQDKPPGKCAIPGTVVDALTGKPLNKVDVWVDKDGEEHFRPTASGMTGAEGNFAIAGLKPGRYSLAGSRNGYLDAFYGNSPVTGRRPRDRPAQGPRHAESARPTRELTEAIRGMPYHTTTSRPARHTRALEVYFRAAVPPLRALTFVAPVIYSSGSLGPRWAASLCMRDEQHRVTETLERALDSTLESVDSAEELAVGAARRAGFGDDDLIKIGMAVREAVVNAVVHGNRYSDRKKVHFSVTHSPEQLQVTIADEGDGFDFGNLPDPLAPENLMATSGRGIFLIRSFTDEFRMRRLDRGGTEVTMIKHLVSK